MDDMQFAKYGCEIREVLENASEENLEILVRNVVAYAISNNRSNGNYNYMYEFKLNTYY